jgi:hypothetical protein
MYGRERFFNYGNGLGPTLKCLSSDKLTVTTVNGNKTATKDDPFIVL